MVLWCLWWRVGDGLVLCRWCCSAVFISLVMVFWFSDEHWWTFWSGFWAKSQIPIWICILCTFGQTSVAVARMSSDDASSVLMCWWRLGHVSVKSRWCVLMVLWCLWWWVGDGLVLSRWCCSAVFFSLVTVFWFSDEHWWTFWSGFCAKSQIPIWICILRTFGQTSVAVTRMSTEKASRLKNSCSRSCLGLVSVMCRSWFCVAWVMSRGVTVMSQSCFRDALLMSRGCRDDVSVMSRCCFSGVMVMSRCCFRNALLWCLGDVSMTFRWCLSDVSVLFWWCLCDVSVLSLPFFADVSVLFWCGLLVFWWCFGDVSVTCWWHLGHVSLKSPWCVAMVLWCLWWWVGDGLVLCRWCFFAFLMVFWLFGDEHWWTFWSEF